MAAAYGLENITYVPQVLARCLEPRSAVLLSVVGLPHSEVFTSRESVPYPYPMDRDSVALERLFDHHGVPCPPESRRWWAIGYLFESLVALDPASGKIYAFPGGQVGYAELHRNMDSLLFTLIEFRKLERDYDEGMAPGEVSARFTQVVGAFDPTPFTDEDSPWNIALEELEHGIW